MKRTLVIGDIHGGLKGLQQVLKRAKISEKDKLIFVGDYVDGWSDNASTIDFLIKISEKNNCIFIRGNHDYLLHKYLTKNDTNPMWVNHGGASSIKSYEHISEEKKQRHILFLDHLKNYYIDSENRLFVHAGFTNQNGIGNEFNPDMVYWDRTLWEMVCVMDPSSSKNNELYPKRLKNYSEIFIGHTPTTRIGKSTPQNFANVWNVDTGAAFKGCISVMDIVTKDFWQSDPVWRLYPDEKGRN
ncbi:metallophosphatase [Patiriisocius marinistellae]|uniref:Metallophosphatase n=1 Tax=Patiriisocius marinistellae TaxID=2494560 RepID=A0A5J4FTN9_9FLAO|nr:metallophosphoesterase family protein [Patiriisocius marinistellae]GEQ84983.1 metallophosphatase [Patiriisocius marinistellae]